MQKSIISSLEVNTAKVRGVAVILDIMAASPTAVGELINSGYAYEFLGAVLHDVSDDLYEQMEEEMQRQRDSSNPIAGDRREMEIDL